MTKHVYKIWAEWDIGQEDTVYTTKGIAWRVAEELYNLQDFEESFQESVDDGYVAVEQIDLVSE